MKLKLFPSIIAVLASALLAFGLYSWCRCEEMRLLVTIFGGISLMLTIGAAMSVTMPQVRETINLRVGSGIFALLLAISNAIFCSVTTFSVTLYVVVNSLLLLVWLIVLYGIIRAYANMK